MNKFITFNACLIKIYLFIFAKPIWYTNFQRNSHIYINKEEYFNKTLTNNNPINI